MKKYFIIISFVVILIAVILFVYRNKYNDDFDIDSNNLTFDDNWYIANADLIKSSAKQMFTNKECSATLDIVRSMQTKDDFYKLYKGFGTYTDGFIKGDLFYIVQSCSNADKINAELLRLGVTSRQMKKASKKLQKGNRNKSGLDAKKRH